MASSAEPAARSARRIADSAPGILPWSSRAYETRAYDAMSGRIRTMRWNVANAFG